MSTAVLVQVVMDARSPAVLAEFWSVALGYRLDDPPPPFQTWEEALRAAGLPEERWDDASAIVPAHGSHGPRVFFQKVSEAKQVKNRVHLDVSVPREMEDLEQQWEVVMAHVERLIGGGATLVEERRGDWGERWMVMTDPEGNEFCVS